MASTDRFPQRGYPRDEQGRPLCRECKTLVQKPRRTFCSDACVERWNAACPFSARKRVFERDKGVCAVCELDCVQEREALLGLRHPELGARLASLGLPQNWDVHRSLWEADHIVPVVEGGGDGGDANLRTLCWPCHRAATTVLQRRLAERRKQGATP